MFSFWHTWQTFWATVQFRDPELLLLLALPLIGLLWRFWRQYRQPAQFADVALWPWVRADWVEATQKVAPIRVQERLLRWLHGFYSPLLWLILAWACWVIALAGPRTWLSETQHSQRQGADILVVMDVSRSMLAEDVVPNRFLFAKGWVEALNHQLQPSDRIGLMAFQAYPHLISPLSEDHALLNHYLALTHVDMMPTRGSRLEKALVAAHHYLDQTATQPGVIIVLTNGRPDFWKLQPTPQGFKTLSQSRHQTIILGVGETRAVPLPVADPKTGQAKPLHASGLLVKSRLEKVYLQQLASQIHGHYFTLENSAGFMQTVLKQIADKAGTHTQTQQQGRWQDHAYPFMVAGTLWLIWAFYPLQLFRPRRQEVKDV